MILGLGNTIPSDSVRQGLGGGGGFTNTYSLAFDAVDDYVSMGNPTALQITGELTLSCWVKITGSTGSNQAFIYKDAAGAGRCYKLQLQGSTNLANFTIFNGGTPFHTYSTSTINDGNWHHIVAVYTPSTSVVLYVDGVAETTNTSSVPASIDNDPVPFELGRRADGVFYLQGSLDEVAVFNTALTPANVTSIYNSGVPNNLDDLTTPPVVWYRNGDNSSYKSPQWLIPENSNKDKVSNYSFAFDGVGDNIDLGTSILDGLGALSISFWFNTSYNGWQYFLGDNSFRLNMNQAGDDVRMQFNGSIDYRADPLPVTLNTWNNIVVVFDGSLTQANRLKLYLNGSLATNILSGTADTTFVASNNFRLGRVGSFSGNQFVGMMDEVSFFNTALTSGNVTSIYNSGTPTTLPAGAVAHYKMGEEATFSTNWVVPDQVGSNDGTSSNMTIEDRVGDAPNSNNNALSYNMTESDRETDVPT